jgi:hypothetical protein
MPIDDSKRKLSRREKKILLSISKYPPEIAVEFLTRSKTMRSLLIAFNPDNSERLKQLPPEGGLDKILSEYERNLVKKSAEVAWENYPKNISEKDLDNFEFLDDENIFLSLAFECELRKKYNDELTPLNTEVNTEVTAYSKSDDIWNTDQITLEAIGDPVQTIDKIKEARYVERVENLVKHNKEYKEVIDRFVSDLENYKTSGNANKEKIKIATECLKSLKDADASQQGYVGVVKKILRDYKATNNKIQASAIIKGADRTGNSIAGVLKELNEADILYASPEAREREVIEDFIRELADYESDIKKRQQSSEGKVKLFFGSSISKKAGIAEEYLNKLKDLKDLKDNRQYVVEAQKIMIDYQAANNKIHVSETFKGTNTTGKMLDEALGKLKTIANEKIAKPKNDLRR